MKTLITLIATAVFTLIGSFAFSAEKSDPVKFLKVETIVDHYINATTQGETELLNYLFSDDFKQSSPTNSNSKSVNKRQLINHLKSLKNIKTLCETDYSFVEKNEDCSIVKVISTYEKFQRVDYITLCNSEDGWKISNVTVAYPEK